MPNPLRSFIRASAFIRKEIFEVLRQPRLVATLVLGPFLILLVFGIGYRAQARTLRTLFVVQPNSVFTQQDIEEYGKTMTTVLVYAGVTNDQTAALDQLHKGQVDLVIVLPQDTAATLKSNQQAVVTLYHNEIDPTQVSYVDYVGWLYVGEVNQQVLRALITQGQQDAATLHNNLQEAHQNAASLRQAVQAGDATQVKQNQQALAANVDTLSLGVGIGLGLLDRLQAANGSGSTAPLQSVLADLRQNTDQVANNGNTSTDSLSRMDKIDQDLTQLDSDLAEFEKLDPGLIVSPFRSESHSMANIQPSLSDFFAPAVLALLLQHLAVTFAALSIVRERSMGSLELFHVAPLSALEMLAGKFLSYLLFGGVIAALLAALLVFGLHVPMLGSWWYFAGVVAAILFTSLAYGFVISIVSQTDSQAVQYSMILLLASVVFSGFIMSLDLLWEPVRVISWLLPTTYGTFLLRDIALRGASPNWLLLGGLLGIGLVLALSAWLLMRRLISSSQ